MKPIFVNLNKPDSPPVYVNICFITHIYEKEYPGKIKITQVRMNVGEGHAYTRMDSELPLETLMDAIERAKRRD